MPLGPRSSTSGGAGLVAKFFGSLAVAILRRCVGLLQQIGRCSVAKKMGLLGGKLLGCIAFHP